MQGYTSDASMGVFFWPIIFSAIIGYVYIKQQSFTAAAVAALIIFAAFSNQLMKVPVFVNLMSILVSLAITGLILVFVTKLRR